MWERDGLLRIEEIRSTYIERKEPKETGRLIRKVREKVSKGIEDIMTHEGMR